MIQLINDDCLKKLPTIPNGSIDLILTDPPYGTTACKWDCVIPFEPMWKELKRIIKDNGCIALFGSEPFSSSLRISNIKWFRYDWIWEKSKSTNFLNAKKQPLRKHEDICIFYKNLPTYNPQMKEGLPYNKGFRKKQNTESYGLFNSVEVKSNGLRYPTDLIYFKTAESEGNVVHPTQKPVALLEYLIKTYTNKNDTVLDFTMGSGSTGVASKNLNRNFIGIEKDQKYFDIAKQKIEGTLIK